MAVDEPTDAPTPDPKQAPWVPGHFTRRVQGALEGLPLNVRVTVAASLLASYVVEVEREVRAMQAELFVSGAELPAEVIEFQAATLSAVTRLAELLPALRAAETDEDFEQTLLLFQDDPRASSATN